MSFDGDKQFRGKKLLTRRTALQLGGAATLLGSTLGSTLGARRAFADTYPNGPINLIIPLPPGTLLDIMGRSFSERFQQDLKYGFVIENVPGASSNVGVARAARAKPDGSTVLFTVSSPMTTNALLYKDMPFDPDKDFIPVIMTGTAPVTLAVHKSFPAQTLAEYIAYAKAHPGEVSYGSSGPGSPQHLCAEYLASLAGIKLNHIPYKGTSESANEVIGGHVQSAFTSLSLMYEQAKAGLVKILAICEDERSKQAPEIPIVAETVPGFVHAPNGWQAIFVPAHTPDEIVTILNREMNVALKDPQLADRLKGQFVTLTGGTPQVLVDKIKNERATTKIIADKIGLVPQ
jgi:tripartite-type tricarboxylate transporter receptor subunit TctC